MKRSIFLTHSRASNVKRHARKLPLVTACFMRSDSEDDAKRSDTSLPEPLKQATFSTWHFSRRVAISCPLVIRSLCFLRKRKLCVEICVENINNDFFPRMVLAASICLKFWLVILTGLVCCVWSKQRFVVLTLEARNHSFISWFNIPFVFYDTTTFDKYGVSQSPYWPPSLHIYIFTALG